jgi:hypothetical protein
MSQHDMTLDNASGLAFRGDANAALQALASQCSGAAAPSPSFPCQMWGDTGTGRLKQRNSANTAWLDMGPLDAALRDSASAGAYASDTGAANAYVCNFTPAIAARSESTPIRFKAANANTGACTINDGVGVVALIGGAHSALQSGEIIANGIAWIQWNASVGGGSYILLFCTGATEQVANATKSQHAVSMGQLYGGVKGLSRFTSSGSFTAPVAGTYYLSGVAPGGGGGAGSSGSSGCGSGGGGGGAGQPAIRVPVTLTLGQVVPITIGSAGAGGATSQSAGGSGGSLQVGSSGSILSLSGGTGGGGGANINGTSGGPFGGAGYPAGSDSVDVSNNVPGGGGGAGASGPFGGGGGAGRNGTNAGHVGAAAYGYGAGGGGGGGYYMAGAGTFAAGVAGAPGFLTIEW